MSFLNKTTICFHCGRPGFNNRILSGEPGAEVAIDICSNCGARKQTALGTAFIPAVAGTVIYSKEE